MVEDYLPPFESGVWENYTKKDVQFAHDIYKKYDCKHVCDYVMLYLKIDVLLLSEIFEKFIDISIQRYGMDPCWFYTTPGYAWSCAFYKTNQKLELLKDRNLIDFFLQDAIRGFF